MKKNMMNIVRVITIVMIMTVLFTGAALAAEKTVGTVEMTAADRAEALTEKALATKNEVKVEETVVEETIEVVEEEVVVIAAVQEATVETTVEEIEEVIVETAEEFVEADEMEMEAEIASTANGTTANTEVKTIDAATAATSADGVVVEFGNNTAAAKTAETKKALTDVNAKYLGTPNGKRSAITLIGDSTFRDINKLQALIDADNIVCYPTADMTKGVKYMAGHNPGAMSHVAGLKVGSIVRLSNDEGHQDYQIKEIKQGSGSFASITFNTTKGVMDAWTMLKSGSENAVIIQYCIDGVNTLHYGVAL